jgi:hypothetical protein
MSRINELQKCLSYLIKYDFKLLVVDLQPKLYQPKLISVTIYKTLNINYNFTVALDDIVTILGDYDNDTIFKKYNHVVKTEDLINLLTTCITVEKFKLLGLS